MRHSEEAEVSNSPTPIVAIGDASFVRDLTTTLLRLGEILQYWVLARMSGAPVACRWTNKPRRRLGVIPPTHRQHHSIHSGASPITEAMTQTRSVDREVGVGGAEGSPRSPAITAATNNSAGWMRG